MESIQTLEHNRFKILLLFFFLALYTSAQEDMEHTQLSTEQYNIIELKTENLAPLNIARGGHDILCLEGQMTVFGGHTDGFVPTATAEYYKEGNWHIVPLVYPHDHAVVLPLRSGKVFLSGGHREPLGIGHLFSAEIYDPITNTSQGFGCMDLKRAFLNAIEIAEGQIVISGNWFEKDGIEMFENIYDPFCSNALGVKDVSYGRAKPYILRISQDDAIVFSSLSNNYESVDNSVIDRLKGASYHEPFLNTWPPIVTIEVQRSLNQFIGNESEGRYEWLLPVQNPKTQQLAIAHVKGVKDSNSELPSFSLFPLAQSIPSSIDGKEIIYSSLVCDPERQMAYLIGNDSQQRMFVVAFPYNLEEAAPLTIFRTEPQPIIAQSITPLLTPEGDLVFAGGRIINNFNVSDAVIKLPLGDFFSCSDSPIKDLEEKDQSQSNYLWWIILAFLSVGIIDTIFFVKGKKSKPTQKQITDKPQVPSEITEEAEKCSDEKLEEEPSEESIEEDVELEEDIPIDKNLPKDEVLIDLFKRIESLMEDEQLYLNPNLRASDVAVKVNSNTTYVSAAINSQCGCSFTQFLGGYRIAYAQKLMREDPESKLSTISTLSGFTTDSTFFRAFRAITGMSPKEWLATISSDLKSLK